MARPTEKCVYILVYGKKLIAAFRNFENANKALTNLKMVIPTGYPVTPKVTKVTVQG